MSIENWIKQNTATTGAGTITLGAAYNSGFVTFGDQYADGDEVYYTIEDGLNREAGIGTYTAAGTTLSRTTIFETLVNGVFDKTSPTAMTLSGKAVVSVSAEKKALTTHCPVWKDNVANVNSAKVAGVDAPEFKEMLNGMYTYAFASTKEEEVFVAFHINHDFLRGSDFYINVHWAPGSADTGGVVWGFDYMIAERGTGVFGAMTTVTAEQAASGTPFMHQMAESVAISSPANPVDTTVLMRLYREVGNANDTFTGDAFGFSVNLHYQAEMEGTPQKDPDFYAW